MRPFTNWRIFAAAAAALSATLLLVSRTTLAEPAVKVRGSGDIGSATEGTTSLFLMGEASHLGRYIADGEIDLAAGTEVGSFTADGVVAFETADGDTLVGDITLTLNADGTGDFAITWQDTVTFSDGTVVATTGRFANSLPVDTSGVLEFETRPSLILIQLGFELPENAAGHVKALHGRAGAVHGPKFLNRDD